MPHADDAHALTIQLATALRERDEARKALADAIPARDREVAEEIARADAAESERDEARAETNARIAAVICTVGGSVEGYATGSLNYLQRLRALVAIEKAFAAALPQIRSAKYMTEKARDCERAESERDALRAALEKYRHCRHACVDCFCVKEARAALASGGDRG